MCCALPNFSFVSIYGGSDYNRILEEELRDRGSRESKSIFKLPEYNVKLKHYIRSVRGGFGGVGVAESCKAGNCNL